MPELFIILRDEMLGVVKTLTEVVAGMALFVICCGFVSHVVDECITNAQECSNLGVFKHLGLLPSPTRHGETPSSRLTERPR